MLSTSASPAAGALSSADNINLTEREFHIIRECVNACRTRVHRQSQKLYVTIGPVNSLVDHDELFELMMKLNLRGEE